MKKNKSIVLLKLEDVGSPLSWYQASMLSKDDIFAMVKTINRKLDMPLSQDKLSTAFSKFYPDFEKKQLEIGKMKSKNENEYNASALNEIYEIVKENSNILKAFHPLIPSISDDLDEIKKTDYSEKYDILSDKIASFAYELSILSDDIFSSINDHILMSLIVSKLKEIMKNDSIMRRKMKARVEKIEEKMQMYGKNVRINTKRW